MSYEETLAPRYAEIARSLPSIMALAGKSGLDLEIASLVEMLDRKERDMESSLLFNAPAARVEKAAATALADSVLLYPSFTTLKWDTTNGQMWKSTAPTRLTAGASGIYFVQAFGSSPVAAGHLGITLTGSVGGQGVNSMLGAAGVETANSVSVLMRMVKGEYVEAGYYQFSGGSVNIGNLGFMMIFLRSL